MNAALPLLLAVNKYRILDWDLPPILGAPAWLVIVPGLIALSFAIGILFANAVRLRDYGWKLGLILSTLSVSLAVVLLGEYKLGVDLKGGVILVYEINKQETAALNPQGRADQWEMSQLIGVLNRRLNPDGLKEIVVRPFGTEQVEIVVPEVDPKEIELIKRNIATGGVLQFMIVASSDRDIDLFRLAQEQAELQGERKLDREVVEVIDPGDRSKNRRVGFWAGLGRQDPKPGGPQPPPFRSLEVLENGFIRDARTGEIIELTPQQRAAFAGNQPAFEAFLKERGARDVDVLMVYDEFFDIRGDDLGFVGPGRDESLRPCIDFATRGEGVYKMGHVTQENIHRKLAIIFDNKLLSAPVIQSKISERGQITGNFSPEEVNFMIGILRSGSMPVVMQKAPISENQIGSILGRDTIEKGSRSIAVSLGLVLVFMLAYYRFSGLVACFALTLNLLMTIGLMVMLQAPFTLPGLAGLVLTVGMSVDANVLIFERIREELTRGAALRMAIRNGFDKAMSAIIDGNLTTLLTAIVLYFIGTDQIKGFGITLILGILTSMFCALFCSHVILDVGERSRWLKKLAMTHFLTAPQIDWVRWLAPAAVGSVVLIAVGLVATVARGRGLFDIDLAGGTSVTFVLEQTTPEDIVRSKLAAVFKDFKDPKTNTSVDYNVYELSMEAQPSQTVYKVDSSLQQADLLKEKVRAALRTDDGRDLLKVYRMEIGAATEEPLQPPPTAPAIGAPGRAAPLDPPPSGGQAQKDDESSGCDEQPAGEAAEQEPPAAAPAEATPAEAPAAGAAAAAAEPAPSEPVRSEPAAPTAAARAGVKTTVKLAFPGTGIGGEALRDRLAASGKAALNEQIDVQVSNPQWDPSDPTPYEDWSVTLFGVDAAQARQVVSRMKAELESEVVWQTSSEIGGRVSGDARLKAVTAIFVSLLGIIAYIWFRFQKVAWGLAAVVALAHDTLVMLSAIAISYWLAGSLGFLGIEEFKISLPVVAAFLTLIGYSVNDTIIIFDRLREIRGKSPDVTPQMLNDSVNQTLSRTIITSGTTLLVTGILYAFGGPGIHAFAFALVIGVISGTYSTVFIAAPLLLFLLRKRAPQPAPRFENRQVSKSVA